ncbi:MAG: hypothetical protein EBX52_09660 [Proteobacteria bacterium]|nr:hypothetical protein [Pseudomonadota bacterium]
MPIELTDVHRRGNYLWIASWGNGLYNLNLDKGKIRQIPCGKADIENMIWNFLPDHGLFPGLPGTSGKQGNHRKKGYQAPVQGSHLTFRSVESLSTREALPLTLFYRRRGPLIHLN